MGTIIIIGVILVVIWIVTAISDMVDESSEKSRVEEYNAEFEKNQKKEQQKLYEKYLTSPLTAEIVNYISASDMPFEVQVWGDRIVSSYANAPSITYDFTAHRVPYVEISKSVSKPSINSNFSSKVHPTIFLHIYPRVELAKAISALLSDRHNTDYFCVEGDGCVRLKLIPTNNF